MKTKRIIPLALMIAERCDVSYHIPNKELSHSLLFCLEDNLGYTLVPKAELQFFLKDHELCRKKLLDFLRILIESSWSIQEIKEMVLILHWECMEHDEIDMMECILDRVLEKESQRRFMDCKARLIQRRWRNVNTNPYHPCCQRRLQREAGEMLL
jgi:hypothetical protein